MGNPQVTNLFDRIKELVPVNREFIDGFINAVSTIPKVTVVYGGPGTGKTTTPVNMIRRREVPKPVQVVAFNNSTAHWFENKLGEGDCVSVRTIDGIAVSFVGFENMVKVGGDIERGVEVLRRRVASLFHVPYSNDPYKLEAGNELFGLFDYVANKASRAGIDTVIKVLGRVAPVYSAVLNTYIKCLEGKVKLRDPRRNGVIDCRPRFDFTLARLELLNSVVPHVKVGKEDCGPPVTLIVDEFQDMSPLMLGILGRWLSSGDVEYFIVAGDFDQLIYRSLHHADLEIPKWLYNQAKVRHGWQVIELSQSHRVLKPLDKLAIEFLNTFDNDPSPWRRWEGNKEKFGVLYIKPLPLALLEIVKEIEQKEELRWGRVSYAVLAPTNEVVIRVSTALMTLGVLPHFLKGYPSEVAGYIEVVKRVVNGELGLDGLGALDEDSKNVINGILRYVNLRARDYAVRSIVYHLTGEKDVSDSDVMRYVVENELNPKNLAYAENPNAPVFVDTVYTAKGLEFERVYVANFARKGSKIPRDKWGARLFYVALTRSRGSVVIMTSSEGDYEEWFPTRVIGELAKKLGVEVVVA
jgi:hypothetical protein